MGQTVTRCTCMQIITGAKKIQKPLFVLQAVGQKNQHGVSGRDFLSSFIVLNEGICYFCIKLTPKILILLCSNSS